MTAYALLAQSFVGSSASKWLIVMLTVVAAVAIVGTFSTLFGRRQAKVDRRLAGYDLPEGDGYVVAGASGGPDTAIVQRGVDIAGGLADRAGLLGRVERALEEADMPVRAAEVVFYVPIFGILAFLFLALVIGPIAGLIAAGFIGAAPYVYLESKRKARHAKFEVQLPSTLTLMASSLRAGFSLMQALETVSQETAEPSRRELQRVFTEVRLGRPMEDALDEVAGRMRSRDLGWTVMAIRIQREVGGNLASLLDTVADTMTKRAALRREIKALTAEGRLSAVVLSVFPPLMALVMYVIQPDYIGKLFEEPIGVVAVIFAAVMNVVGWFWLKNIVNIED